VSAWRAPQRLSRTLDTAVIGLCDYGSGPDAEVRDPLCAELDRSFDESCPRSAAPGQHGTHPGAFDTVSLAGLTAPV
jgi:hypothetical protein